MPRHSEQIGVLSRRAVSYAGQVCLPCTRRPCTFAILNRKTVLDVPG